MGIAHPLKSFTLKVALVMHTSKNFEGARGACVRRRGQRLCHGTMASPSLICLLYIACFILYCLLGPLFMY